MTTETYVPERSLEADGNVVTVKDITVRLHWALPADTSFDVDDMHLYDADDGYNVCAIVGGKRVFCGTVTDDGEATNGLPEYVVGGNR